VKRTALPEVLIDIGLHFSKKGLAGIITIGGTTIDISELLTVSELGNRSRNCFASRASSKAGTLAKGQDAARVKLARNTAYQIASAFWGANQSK
jgi:hypothetical protein